VTRPTFEWWTRPYPAAVFDLYSRIEFGDLFTTYQGVRHDVLGDVLDKAMQAGARSVVAEYRYLDADYRNEHSRFYSTTFRRYPSVAHRLHFFSQSVPDSALAVDRPSGFEQFGYLGYSVMRPVAAGPVGRTVLRPSEHLFNHVSCKADDRVNLFGSDLTVCGAPFMTQESQLGVCIHVTAWVCTYAHHLRFDAQRFLPGDIASFAPHEVGRLVPAPGMSVGQLSAIFEAAGLPAVVYRVDDLPAGESLFRIACRYLNSGFPVVVAGGGHAFVLVGYRRVPGGEHGLIEFVRQDDQHGPYDLVGDPRFDRWRPWQYLVIPLPPKVYVSGEKAETVAADTLYTAVTQRRRPEDEALLARLNDETVVLRTTAMPSNTFKRTLADRGAPDELVGAYRWTHMSRWIWVVEAVDHDAWDRGDPSVMTEIIIDATDHTGDPRPLTWRLSGELVAWDPDRDLVGRVDLPAVGLLATVCAVDTSLQGGNADA
jgi:hypothetical protein